MSWACASIPSYAPLILNSVFAMHGDDIHVNTFGIVRCDVMFFLDNIWWSVKAITWSIISGLTVLLG